MKTFSITDAGAIREMNQDFYFSSDTAVGNLPNLFIVADGMGGHKAVHMLHMNPLIYLLRTEFLLSERYDKLCELVHIH